MMMLTDTQKRAWNRVWSCADRLSRARLIGLDIERTMEELLNAAHAYGLAIGREGFVEPEKIDRLVELLKVHHYQAISADGERLTGWRAVTAVEESNKQLAKGMLELAEKLAGREAEIGEAYTEIARLRNGEAYKAIVKERDEALAQAAESKAFAVRESARAVQASKDALFWTHEVDRLKAERNVLLKRLDGLRVRAAALDRLKAVRQALLDLT